MEGEFIPGPEPVLGGEALELGRGEGPGAEGLAGRGLARRDGPVEEEDFEGSVPDGDPPGFGGGRGIDPDGEAVRARDGIEVDGDGQAEEVDLIDAS